MNFRVTDVADKESKKIPHKSGENGNGKVGYCRPPVEHQFKPGNPGSKGRPRGPTLYGVVQELLNEKDGKRRRKAGEAFLDALESGSYQHAKELIEREEGSVPANGNVRIIIEHVDANPNDSAEDETAARRAATCN